MTQGIKGIVRNLGKPICSAFKIPDSGCRMIKTQLHGARSGASMGREQATSNAVKKVVKSDNGQTQSLENIGQLSRDELSLQTLGMTLVESKNILESIQGIMMCPSRKADTVGEFRIA